MEFCQNEIKDLLNKGIIQKSKSPWSCPPFYVQKNTKLERVTPILVINYKPFNKFLEWIQYPIPNKRDLINRLNELVVFSKFDMRSEFRKSIEQWFTLFFKILIEIRNILEGS